MVESCWGPARLAHWRQAGNSHPYTNNQQRPRVDARFAPERVQPATRNPDPQRGSALQPRVGPLRAYPGFIEPSRTTLNGLCPRIDSRRKSQAGE